MKTNLNVMRSGSAFCATVKAKLLKSFALRLRYGGCATVRSGSPKLLKLLALRCAPVALWCAYIFHIFRLVPEMKHLKSGATLATRRMTTAN